MSINPERQCITDPVFDMCNIFSEFEHLPRPTISQIDERDLRELRSSRRPIPTHGENLLEAGLAPMRNVKEFLRVKA